MLDKIISVRLSEENIKRLQEIAKKEGVKRSILIKKATNQFIQNYGSAPLNITEISNKVDGLEKKFGSLLTRVNILTTQIDNILRILDKIRHGK